jgi:hypothetical protein
MSLKPIPLQCAETAAPSVGDSFLSISLQLTTDRENAAVWEVEPIRVEEERSLQDTSLASVFPAAAPLPVDQCLVLKLWSRDGKVICAQRDNDRGDVQLIQPGAAGVPEQSDEWECNLVEASHLEPLEV